MKKLVFFLVLLVIFSSCNKDLVEKPGNLIEKGVMIDIMYDMALLDALKYQDPNSLYNNGVNPKTYIYKKYKIDSLQFVKSNAYYAADYREYKTMYDALAVRLKKEKASVDLVIKKEQKKATALKKAKAKKRQDSITKAKKEKELKLKKEKDSILKAKKK
ncbi:DUF4296 domain-containing protein [Flavobacterium laiguense]|uniref:DUF4296 domain-containing protein n=1 Tax=Flavobacterium laiguense TaxID=2169409 RepID=A0A2U1JZQ4_9FLAO|nr:DUF4296 domain-containing protein [Flavobacterium laiguense]PWA10268.1 DUF4296 domain-containing protein [Flavobacterium laiguense]